MTQRKPRTSPRRSELRKRFAVSWRNPAWFSTRPFQRCGMRSSQECSSVLQGGGSSLFAARRRSWGQSAGELAQGQRSREALLHKRCTPCARCELLERLQSLQPWRQSFVTGTQAAPKEAAAAVEEHARRQLWRRALDANRAAGLHPEGPQFERLGRLAINIWRKKTSEPEAPLELPKAPTAETPPHAAYIVPILHDKSSKHRCLLCSCSASQDHLETGSHQHHQRLRRSFCTHVDRMTEGSETSSYNASTDEILWRRGNRCFLSISKPAKTRVLTSSAI